MPAVLSFLAKAIRWPTARWRGWRRRATWQFCQHRLVTDRGIIDGYLLHPTEQDCEEMLTKWVARPSAPTEPGTAPGLRPSSPVSPAETQQPTATSGTPDTTGIS